MRSGAEMTVRDRIFLFVPAGWIVFMTSQNINHAVIGYFVAGIAAVIFMFLPNSNAR